MVKNAKGTRRSKNADASPSSRYPESSTAGNKTKVISFAGMTLGHLQNLPVPCHLSFRHLIESLSLGKSTGSPQTDALNHAIATKASQNPKMLSTIENENDLKELLPEITDLMSAIFPVNFGDHNRFAASTPFTPYSFFASHAFARSLLDDQHQFRGKLADSSKTLEDLILQNMLTFILVHGFEAKLPLELIYHRVEVPNTKNNLIHYERLSLDLSYCRLHMPPDHPTLSDTELDQAIALLHEPRKLLPYLPLEGLAIEGFSILRSFDVSSEESLNKIRESLLESNDSNHGAQWDSVQSNIQNLTQDPSLTVSLYTYFDEKVYCLQGADSMVHDLPGLGFLLDPTYLQTLNHLKKAPGNQGSKVCLITKSDLSPYEQNLKHQGRKTLLVAPLQSNEKTIGYIEFASSLPSSQFHLKTFEMQSLVSLLSILILRRIDTINQKIENVIKLHCTSVHPSVEWKFREASSQFLALESAGRLEEQHVMDEIIFNNVYPLYALCRIENYDQLRNQAARDDLLTYLSMVEELIQKAEALHHTPLYAFMLEQIKEYQRKVQENISTSLEFKVTEYIHQSIVPLIRMIIEQVPELRQETMRFQNKIDQNLNVFYLGRGEVESSINFLNQEISRVITTSQLQAQSNFPHYFEKHISKGVEYTIFVGENISPRLTYHANYLKNLRLWQLVTSCQVAKAAEALRNEIPVDLKVGQLIIAEDVPVKLEFDYDERRFYYLEKSQSKINRVRDALKMHGRLKEIESLTKNGFVNVLCSENKEKEEYLAYFRHMQNLGFLSKSSFEKNEVINLPEMSPMMLLRFEISHEYLGADSRDKENENNLIEAALNKQNAVA